MLLLVGLIYGVLYLRYQGTLSVAGFRTVMWCTFGGLIFFHYVLASELVPAHVAGLIAGERERRTIGDLLVTRLSSAEIVLGKLTAGLAQFATTFAISVPALVLVPHSSSTGGVGGARFVVLLCLGLIAYRDFAKPLGQGSFSYLSVLGIVSNEGAGRVLMALLIAISGYTAAAAWLTRTVIRRFDQFAGRAARSPGSDTTDSTARAHVVNRNGSESRCAIPTRVRSAPVNFR